MPAEPSDISATNSLLPQRRTRPIFLAALLAPLAKHTPAYAFFVSLRFF
ncbi:hypothetical protein EVA_02760 [gut metagenome]|uniref:Uncharacterized protein n=1 Tax=gut metagenome TaxID=749906 RepID=J9GNE0_9ZZZZ